MNIVNLHFKSVLLAAIALSGAARALASDEERYTDLLVIDKGTGDIYLQNGKNEPRSLKRGIRNGTTFTVRFLNLNSLKYKVKVSADSKSFFLDKVPDEFKNYAVKKTAGADATGDPEAATEEANKEAQEAKVELAKATANFNGAKNTKRSADTGVEKAKGRVSLLEGHVATAAANLGNVKARINSANRTTKSMVQEKDTFSAQVDGYTRQLISAQTDKKAADMALENAEDALASARLAMLAAQARAKAAEERAARLKELEDDIKGWKDELNQIKAFETLLDGLQNLGSTTEAQVKGATSGSAAKAIATKADLNVTDFKSFAKGQVEQINANGQQLSYVFDGFDENSFRPFVKTGLDWVDGKPEVFKEALVAIEKELVADGEAAGRDELLKLQKAFQKGLESLKTLQADRPKILASADSATEYVRIARGADYMQIDGDGSFQATGDEMTITYSITEVGAKDPGADNKLTVDVNSGSKIDFSTGIIATGLHDESYKKVGDKKKTISEEGRIAFGSFAHYYFRNLRDMKLGFSLGIALEDKPIYMAGLSLLLGKKQRIVITGGIAYGKVARFDSFDADNNAVTRDVYKQKYFLGVSWNF